MLVKGGFWDEEVKPFGPVQLHVTAPFTFAFKLTVFPTHEGLGLEDTDALDG